MADAARSPPAHWADVLERIGSGCRRRAVKTDMCRVDDGEGTLFSDGMKCVRQSPRAVAADIEFYVAANTASYCVAHRTMPHIYKTLKAGVSFMKLITNNNCETPVREHCELTTPAG